MVDMKNLQIKVKYNNRHHHSTANDDADLVPP